MTKSNRDATKAGELGGNVLEQKATLEQRMALDAHLATGKPLALPSPETMTAAEFAALFGLDEVAAARDLLAPTDAEIGFNPAPGLVSSILGARDESDMDENTLSFLRRRTAHPSIHGPRCGLEFDGAACCLDKGHPGYEHAWIDEHAWIHPESRGFVWRAFPGVPTVIVYDKRAEMILGQTLTTDLLSKQATTHEKLLAHLTDQIGRAILGDEIMDAQGAVDGVHGGEYAPMPPRAIHLSNPTMMEAGQIWDFNEVGMSNGRYVVIHLYEIDCAALRRNDRPIRQFGDDRVDAGCKCAAAISTPEKARCVGFEHADGQRVMIGEARVCDHTSQVYFVVAIRSGARLLLSTTDGNALDVSAATFSSWEQFQVNEVGPRAPIGEAMEDIAAGQVGFLILGGVDTAPSRTMHAQCASADVTPGEQDRAHGAPSADCGPSFARPVSPGMQTMIDLGYKVADELL